MICDSIDHSWPMTSDTCVKIFTMQWRGLCIKLHKVSYVITEGLCKHGMITSNTWFSTGCVECGHQRNFPCNLYWRSHFMMRRQCSFVDMILGHWESAQGMWWPLGRSFSIALGDATRWAAWLELLEAYMGSYVLFLRWINNPFILMKGPLSTFPIQCYLVVLATRRAGWEYCRFHRQHGRKVEKSTVIVFR